MPADELRYAVRAPTPRWLVWFWAASVVLIAGNLVLAVLRDAPARAYIPYALYAVALVFIVYSRRRPPQVVVDGRGVRVPLRGLTSWADVVAVKPANAFDDVLVLRLADHTERRTPLPPELIDRVAAIGKKPVE